MTQTIVCQITKNIKKSKNVNFIWNIFNYAKEFVVLGNWNSFIALFSIRNESKNIVVSIRTRLKISFYRVFVNYRELLDFLRGKLQNSKLEKKLKNNFQPCPSWLQESLIATNKYLCFLGNFSTVDYNLGFFHIIV